MTKFTEADFLSTTIMTRSRTRKLKFTVVSPNPHLNDASTSPICAGGADITTEPFPLFEEIFPPTEPAEFHCSTHCSDEFCKTLRERKTVPSCRCAEAPMLSPIRGPLLTPSKDKVSLDGTIFDDIQGLNKRTKQDHIVVLDRNHVLASLSRLEGMVAARAVKNEGYLAPLRVEYPASRNKAARVLRSRIEEFFESMHDYVKRVTSLTNEYSLTVGQLRTELNVYMATGFRKLLESECDHETLMQMWDDAIKQSGHPMKIMGAVTEGEFGIVARVWEEALDDVMAMLIWRSAKSDS
ncbi:hypothetical protein FB567DRAFT_517318 [Paraphoma chrysanthemicola]|uniref:Uncharacterized protein n=1 Tax=Paraphoma chrysanthemicola TaxID=798071 RepID=A0A8K0RH27_9PLEO|nr:hypothetical protein FB567DRAFT_517318 [Paraphoma chrysanthemicola]